MATWVKTEPIQGRQAEEDVRKGTGQETQGYRVYFDGPDANAADAIYASGIPPKGSRLGSTNLYCAQRKAKVDPGDAAVFIVDVIFITPDFQQQEKPPESTKWNVQITGSSVAWQEEVERDKNKKIILNIVNESPSPKLVKVNYDEQINVSFTCDVPDWATIDGCRGKSNDTEIVLTINGSARAFAAKTLKLDSTSWALIYDAAGVLRVQFNLTFLYRVDTWTEKVPQISYNYINLINGKVTPITADIVGGADGDKTPVNHPYYLDDNGQPLHTTGDAVVTYDADIVETTSFATLLTEIA
jgi:hypothetical protein